ncbi:MAG: glycosyltransferase family 39 protein [Chitinophagales bacterium]|nr:glycosyltransferase family 39 protein [Chitinophagales bacterium]MDW8420050.1 glycosyltransferase family 39 protein [Chitinophagales bacterium]
MFTKNLTGLLHPKSPAWFWLLIIYTATAGCWQISCTELLPDEAYYWLYAQNPDWGYFDHPPMVALFIRVGYAFFKHEAGVRIVFLLVSLLSLYIARKIAKPTHELLFAAAVLSLPAMQLGNGIAAPDIPLLFFALLFISLAGRFAATPSPTYATALALVTAAMLYSKYHAVLIILFSILAYPAVLRLRWFWVAAALCALLYLPHLWWQWQRGFPSVVYHLSSRHATSWSIGYTLNYILGQWLMLGPLISLPMLYFLFRWRPPDISGKLMQYNVIGFLLFFLLSSFRSNVEANWTSPILVPFAILCYKVAESDSRLTRLITVSGALMAVIVLIIKFVLTAHATERYVAARSDWRGWKSTVLAVQSVAGKMPVAFMNSYQLASLYQFYTKQVATSVNTTGQRSNQFDYWQYGVQMCGRQVLLITNDWYYRSPHRISTPRCELSYVNIPAFHTAYHIELRATPLRSDVLAGDTLPVTLFVQNKFTDTSLTAACISGEATISYQFIQPGHHLPPVSTTLNLNPRMQRDTLRCLVKAPLVPGRYELYFTASGALSQIHIPLSHRLVIRVKQQ